MEGANTIYNYFTTNTFSAKSEKVFADDIRLNAEYYVEGKSLLLDSTIEFVPLSSLASVVFPGIFKRYLVDDIKYGIKFLTTSDMMMLEPETSKILSTDLTTNLDIYRVTENTLLVSRSGTIGNTIYVDERIKDFALTEDALRVRPFDQKHIGFLYFYFISEYGNNTITGKKSGAVIDHIYEDDLLKLPVPKFSTDVVQSLYDNFLRVKENRESAHNLINKARALVLKYNDLPSLTEDDTININNDDRSKFRVVSSSEFTHDFRLDAHFYSNIFRNANKAVANGPNQSCMLSTLTDDIFMGNRFTRNLVDANNGIPFIGTKNTLQIRPTEFKYLSTTETANIENLILKRNWILIARSGSLGGTFGKTSFVWKNFENYAGSEHIIRICTNSSVDPAYLYAYLSSPYGYLGITQLRHGALIDEIDPDDLGKIRIPILSDNQQKEIGDLVRQAYDMRAEALGLEDTSIQIITDFLTKA